MRRRHTHLLYEARGRFQIVTLETIALPASPLHGKSSGSLGEVRGHAARLVTREVLHAHLPLRLFLEIEVAERLPGG